MSNQIAYCGVKGAYSHIAAGKIFPEGEFRAYPNFRLAYEAVEKGECRYVVLPIENSTAGDVGSNVDMIFEGPLWINGIYELHITHNLLGKPGTPLDEIREVISHPQALEQCGSYLEEHGFHIQSAQNTAIAAKEVAEGKNPYIAAIASKETAKLYGLSILAEGINECDNNTTRFAVLSKTRNAGRKKENQFVLMFTVRHEAGALAKAIAIIGEYGFNMVSIKSRALKGLLWQYYFCVEVEGDGNSMNCSQMCKDLHEYCDKLKVVGTYEAHKLLED